MRSDNQPSERDDTTPRTPAKNPTYDWIITYADGSTEPYRANGLHIYADDYILGDAAGDVVWSAPRAGVRSVKRRQAA